MEAGFPVLIADGDGERLTPSVVHYPKTGDPLTGRAAARFRAIAPERTVYSVKRFMGRRIGEEADGVPYHLSGAAGSSASIEIDERSLSPEEVSSAILRKLKKDAERSLGIAISRAVITVPAYFNDAQRSATKRAGEMAGFVVERIVNEPTAAALAYGLNHLKESSKVAVYDLGGGTFDITVLELSEGVFHVLATNGDTRLGGDDIDNSLLSWLTERLRSEAGVETLDQETVARLREAVVAAKHRLSVEYRTEIALPFASIGHSLGIFITREDLERLALPIVERTRRHCLHVLSDSGLDAASLDDVILVGGQTRMPLVRRVVKEIFGKTPNVSQNPDEAVAIGATIQGGILSGAVQNVLLLDVTPLSLGIETFGGLMNVIIPRNSTIPCKAGEMFTNAVAGQREMLIHVMQGEREMVRDNWALGKFVLPFEPAAKGKARVGVQFEIDANGILHVLVRDVATGRELVVEVTSAVDVSDEAIEKMLEDSLEHAFEDVSERIFTEAKLKSDELMPAVRKALEQLGDKVDAAERAEVKMALSEVETAIAQGGADRLKKANAALDAATQHLAVLVIEHATAR